MNESLFFTKVPEKWEHYLPLGNGRLGAMVKAHPCNEVIQLNEEGIWSGGPIDRVNPCAYKNLNEIRRLVKEGRVLEAQALGFQSLSGTCFNERVYQTAGEFRLDFFGEDNPGIACGFPLQHSTPEACLSSYKSSLSLSQACTTVSYTDEKGVEFTRTSWISAVDDILFIQVKASKKASINFSGYLDRGIWVDSIYAEDGFLFLEDSHGIPFTVGVGAVAEGGSVNCEGFCISGKACDQVLFFIDIRAWKYNSKAVNQQKYRKLIKKNVWKKEVKNHLEEIKAFVASKDFSTACEDLFAWHLVEYENYWKRMSLSIGKTKSDSAQEKEEASLSTPELLRNAGPANTELVNLYLNFSRYLLISGSRTPGQLPLTLQGLWNCYMDPPWGSKYTININTQMNYWPVNMTGLHECQLPLFELLERAYKNGCDIAKRMYHCRGYLLHHNTDFWGDAAPQDAWLPGTYWTLGAAWLATHIWEHYEYTQDKALLQKYYYLIHDACLFFVDFLVPCDLIAPDGKPYLVLNPSVSPENSYVTKTGETGAFTEGCEMDNMILHELFTDCLKAAAVLSKNCDEKDYSDFRYVLNHLKNPELNSDGSLMEWNKEVTEVEPGHRHISHLYGLYPGHSISLEKNPQLAEAAKKTLEKRLSNGGGHTGWSQAWIINFRSQLCQGDLALTALTRLLQNSTLPNLLDNHPPFQIDGNFGALAAVLRMFVQSEIDEKKLIIKLLPALPSQPEWQNGSLFGLCLKGGYSLDFEWKNGKVEEIKLHASPLADKTLQIVTIPEVKISRMG